MKKKSRCTCASFFLLCALIISGCSVFNETRFESSLGKDVNLISYSYDIADDLIQESFPPLTPRHPDLPVLTTTFVDNNDLNSTSHFGRLLQEHISSRFVQQGYTVKEIKLAKNLTIKEYSGETILSRELSRIEKNQKAQALLVGTISHTQRTMYISARLVNPLDQSVISSKNYRLYMDQNVLAMFKLRSATDDDLIAEPQESMMNTILY